MRATQKYSGAMLNPSDPINFGLKGWWNFSEGAGAKTNDLSARRNTGAITAAAWSGGVNGRSLSFASTGFVNTGATLIPASGDFSVSAIIYLANYSEYRAILGQHATGQAGRFIIETVISTGEVTVFNGADNLTGLIIPLNRWVHVTIIRRGDVYSSYLDTKRGTDRTSSTALYQGQPSVIGAANTALVDPWNGLISSVRIWDRAITNGEVERIVADDNAGLYSNYSKFMRVVAGASSIPVFINHYRNQGFA